MLEPTFAVARILSGLLAGIYLAFAIVVMPALHTQQDHVFEDVMRRMIVVIVNPLFLLVFLGAPACALTVLLWNRTPVLVIAAVLAVVALLITIGANVPLNDRLAASGSRPAFETPWVLWHIVRTVAAVGSFALLSVVKVP